MRSNKWRLEDTERKISRIRRILNDADERFADACFADSEKRVITCTDLLDEVDFVLNKIYKELE